MKTKLKYFCMSVIAGLTLSFSSCADFMDLTPEDQYDESEVWKDADLVKTIVNDIYSYVCDIAQEVNTSAWTDDAFFTHVYGCRDINEATVSPSNLGAYDRDDCPFKWSKQYKGIYRANLILSRIGEVPEKVGVDLNEIKGETYFLRAYLYTEMLRGFGGIPIVDKVYTIEEAAELSLPRANVADVMDFILKDIEQAISLLPEQQTGEDVGRATKGAAKALKARLLLHIASPLFADRTVNTLACNQYTGDRQALYQQALDAAKDVINSGSYSLIDCNAVTIKEIAEKFHNIIITNNEETIWAKQYVNKDQNADNWVHNRVALLHGPNGYHNWAGTAPTHDLAMAFETEEGKVPNTLLQPGEETTVNPYTNREPRFYATIGYDGAEWGRPRASDGAVFDATPLGNLQFGYYELSSGGSEVNAVQSVDDENKAIKSQKFNGMVGVDTRMSNIENWNGTYTGYLEKKLIDGTVNATEHNFQTNPMPYIRLAEMYLIAAEACIELNKLDEAAIYLDAIRTRIGRPNTKETLTVRGQAFNQNDLREFLRQERRVELAYEESRYYDVRRWMIAPETSGKKLTGVTIVGRLKPGKTATLPYVHDETVYDYTWTVLNLNYIEKRKWDNKMYFAPIKLEETLRNTALEQNPGFK